MVRLPDGYRGELRQSVNLSALTTWRVGGPADYLAIPGTVDDLSMLLEVIKTENLPWIMVGSGSNILFSDAGFRGIIIQLGAGFRRLEFNRGSVYAGASVMLKKLALEAADNGLTGMESLAGIPGTCGAAATINAGAYGNNFLDHVKTVHIVDENGKPTALTDVISRYRTGAVTSRTIITGLELTLETGSRESLMAITEDFIQRRKLSQPITLASAGCTFKNPPGKSAGKIIDELQMKNLRVGGAVISDQHANFIINDSGATARDIMELIQIVRDRVFNETGLMLQLEVRVYDSGGFLMESGVQP